MLSGKVGIFRVSTTIGKYKKGKAKRTLSYKGSLIRKMESLMSLNVHKKFINKHKPVSKIFSAIKKMKKKLSDV